MGGGGGGDLVPTMPKCVSKTEGHCFLGVLRIDTGYLEISAELLNLKVPYMLLAPLGSMSDFSTRA